MKKNILTLAVAAGLIASAGVASADPTLYGRVHLALETSSDGNTTGTSGVAEDTDMNSRKSVIGVKGTEDLGGGLKAFYKLEWEVDPADSGTGGKGKNLDGRDQFAGLKGGWGKVLFGTASTNYKQMGGKVDPFWHHAAEGRGYTNTMSFAHGSKGNTGQGRQENMLQYTTPKMAGIELVVNYTLSGKDGTATTTDTGDEVLGVGGRWSNKAFLVFIDYIDPSQGGSGAIGSPAAGLQDESLIKIGGKWTAKQFWLSAQYEAAEDQTGGDYMFVGGNFDINKNNAIMATIGQHTDLSTGYAIGYTHSMSKQTKVYIDYSALSDDLDDTPAGYEKFDDSVIALGFIKSF